MGGDAEALDYGYGSSSNIRTFINILKSYVGGGILALPYAFSRGGYLIGVLGYIFISLGALHCIFILLKCKDYIEQNWNDFKPVESNSSSSMSRIQESDSDQSLEHENRSGNEEDMEVEMMEPNLAPQKVITTFSELGYHVYGRVGTVLVDLGLLSSQYSFCIIYLVFLGDSLHSFIPLPASICLLMVLIFPLALCWIRSLKWLAPLSVMAIFLYFVCFSAVTFLSFMSAVDFPSRSVTMAPKMEHVLSHFPIFLSLVIYGYEGIGMVLPLQISARDKSKFPLIFMVAYAIVTAIYIGFGLFGYMCFGIDSNPILFLNLTYGKQLVHVFTVGLIIAAVFTFPLFMFPVTERVEPFFLRLFYKVPEIAAQKLFHKDLHEMVSTGVLSMILRNIYRSLAVLLCYIIAIAVPEFDLLTALVGAVFSTSLAFIIPALFELRIFGLRYKREGISVYYIVKDALIILAGLIAMVLCTSVTLVQLYDRLKHKYL